MVPLPAFAKSADRMFVVGQVYSLEEIEERSAATHRHFFAAINDAWANLPEHLAERFQSPVALRKYALIKAGFCDSRSIPASSKAQAERLAAFIKPMDAFAVVTVKGSVVTVYTARSQSLRAMGRDEFQRSKQAVLDVIADMIGVAPDQLASQAGRAA